MVTELRLDAYKRNNLDNIYVNKSERLHRALDSNKNNLINTYLTYLENKIAKWMGTFERFPFTSFNEYRNIIYTPLKKELDEFKNNCYDNNYSYDINRYKALEGTLEADGLEARRNMRNKDN